MLPGIYRITVLIILFIILYSINAYEKYIKFYLGLVLEWFLGEEAGTEYYEPALTLYVKSLLKALNHLDAVDAFRKFKNIINDVFCYVHRLIIVFILISTNNRKIYFFGYFFLLGILLFFSLNSYLPLFTLWVVLANFIFFYFDHTYIGFINNLGRHNPELGDRKLALTKLNIITIQHWVIRKFAPYEKHYLVDKKEWSIALWVMMPNLMNTLVTVCVIFSLIKVYLALFMKNANLILILVLNFHTHEVLFLIILALWTILC